MSYGADVCCDVRLALPASGVEVAFFLTRLTFLALCTSQKVAFVKMFILFVEFILDGQIFFSSSYGFVMTLNYFLMAL